MLFSVIVPIYRVEAFLHKCVDSILTQTFGDFELILVDDGSPDGCGAICDEYARADARVRVIHKPNGGVVSARNAGLDVVTGEYVCYVDGDDWVAENWLEAIKNQIESAPMRPDLVVFDAVKVYDDHTEKLLRSISDGFYDKRRLKAEVYPFLISDRRLSFGTGNIYGALWIKAFKRQLTVEHYCREKRLIWGEDDTITYECFFAADNAMVCSDTLYYYNKMNESSALTSYKPNCVRAYALLFSYLRERVGGRAPMIDRQLNDLYANRIIRCVSHEIVCGHPMNSAVRHIRDEFKETGILDYVVIRGLPLYGALYLLLLKFRMYRLAYLGAKIRLKLN